MSKEKGAEQAAEQGLYRLDAVDFGAQPKNENGPGRCANTVIPGPRRSTEEID